MRQRQVEFSGKTITLVVQNIWRKSKFETNTKRFAKKFDLKEIAEVRTKITSRVFVRSYSRVLFNHSVTYFHTFFRYNTNAFYESWLTLLDYEQSLFLLRDSRAKRASERARIVTWRARKSPRLFVSLEYPWAERQTTRSLYIVKAVA